MDKQAARTGISHVLDQLLYPFTRHTALRQKLNKHKHSFKKLLSQVEDELINVQGLSPKDARTARLAAAYNHPDAAKILDKIKKLTRQANEAHSANKAFGAITGGAALGAVGTGATFATLKDALSQPERKERGKIQTSMALKELQSDLGTEESAFSKASSAVDANKLLMLGGGALAAGAVPSYIAMKWLRDVEAGKDKDQIRSEIHALKKLYDRKFRDSVMEDLNVDSTDLKGEVTKMAAASGKVSDFISQHAPELAMGLGGVGLGAGAFMLGKSHGEDASENLAKMKAYRQMLDRVSRLRNAPVTVTDAPFSPEEMIALEQLRSESPKAKKKKAPKKKEEPKKVSADADSPELQELLGSI